MEKKSEKPASDLTEYQQDLLEKSRNEQLFIERYKHLPVHQLALQAHRYPHLDFPFVLNQIAGWQIARTKLPSWAAKDGIVYPPHISIEQCSSEPTARYKARLAMRLLDNNLNTLNTTNYSLTDLTGGFGIDFAFMAQTFGRAVYVEQQVQLCKIAQHNLHLLGLTQAEVVCGDSTEYLHTLKASDIIFLDPARRNEYGGKTIRINDCTPNVLALEDELLAKSQYIIIKLSPMLDWHQAVGELNRHDGNVVREVHIVSVHNECKELLIVLQGRNAEPSARLNKPLHVFCINDNTVFDYSLSQTHPQQHTLDCLPATGWYLYEPNASLMKAGCFGELTARYPLRSVSTNSHLFVSTDKIDNFPGRSFTISAVSSMNKKELKHVLQEVDKANITVRNFPISAIELRKRLRIKDGGNRYIFATTTADDKHIILIGERADK